MKKSQLAVVSALGFVVAVMIAFGIWLRLVAEPMPALSGERTTRTYDLADFRGVEADGHWQITIERGDAWLVSVEAPAELIDQVSVERQADGDAVDLEGPLWFGRFADDQAMLQAKITMPSLESVDVSGTSILSFSGFEGSALSIDFSGGGQLRGSSSRFDELMLDLSGAGDIDLSDVAVTDAEVDISAAANVRLQMAGGRLTGDISGAANLEYSGAVSEESIDRSGLVNVRQRQRGRP
jgi:hypothetical protein